jgi:hypothetical protein
MYLCTGRTVVFWDVVCVGSEIEKDWEFDGFWRDTVKLLGDDDGFKGCSWDLRRKVESLELGNQ